MPKIQEKEGGMEFIASSGDEETEDFRLIAMPFVDVLPRALQEEVRETAARIIKQRQETMGRCMPPENWDDNLFERDKQGIVNFANVRAAEKGFIIDAKFYAFF